MRCSFDCVNFDKSCTNPDCSNCDENRYQNCDLCSNHVDDCCSLNDDEELNPCYNCEFDNECFDCPYSVREE